MTAESWLEPDVAEDEIFSPATESLGKGAAEVIAVLGAGNVASIPATEIIGPSASSDSSAGMVT